MIAIYITFMIAIYLLTTERKRAYAKNKIQIKKVQK